MECNHGTLKFLLEDGSRLCGGCMATRIAELDIRVAELANGLIEIAELAMPDTYLATDSRVKLARESLGAEAADEDSDQLPKGWKCKGNKPGGDVTGEPVDCGFPACNCYPDGFNPDMIDEAIAEADRQYRDDDLRIKRAGPEGGG